MGLKWGKKMKFNSVLGLIAEAKGKDNFEYVAEKASPAKLKNLKLMKSALDKAGAGKDVFWEYSAGDCFVKTKFASFSTEILKAVVAVKGQVSIEDGSLTVVF